MQRIFFAIAFMLFLPLTLHGKDTLEFYSSNRNKDDAEREISKILESKNLHSIADLYNKTAIHYANNGKPQKAVGYFNYAIDLYDSLGAVNEKALNYGYLASTYYELGRYEKSIDFLRRSYILHLHLKDSISAAQQKIDIAFVYSNTFRSTKALESFKEALGLYKKLRDTTNIAKTYYYIGREYLENSELDSTLAYYKKTLELDIVKKAQIDIIASYNNIGVIYYKKNDYVSAKEYFDRSQVVAQQINHRESYGIYYNNVGNIFFEKGNYRIADSTYRVSLKYKRELKDKDGEAATLFNIANIYRKIGKRNEAIATYEQSLALASIQSNGSYVAQNYKALSELYKETRQFEKAFAYYQKYVSNMYSILADEDHKQMTEVQSKYENTRKVAASLEREMKMQKLFADYNENIKRKEIQTERQKERIRRNWNIFFAGIFLIICIGVLIIIKRNREKKTANKILDSQNNEIEQSNKTIEEQTELLRASNIELEKLSVVARETDTAILIMSADGRYEWVNEAYSKFFGITNEQLDAEEGIIFESINSKQVIRKLEECSRTKEPISYESGIKNKEGESMWVNVTLTPILDKDGEISRIISINSDITSIKNAEAEILQQKEEIETQRDELQDQHDYVLGQKEEIEEQKNRLAESLAKLQSTQKKLVESEKMAALGSLVAGVAHEINTPIGIGLAASTSMFNKSLHIEELFANKTMKLSDLSAYLENANHACELILSNLNRTAELVKSFKQVSIDNMTEQKREFILDQYIDDVVRSLAPKIKHRPVDISVQCPKGLTLISFPGAFAQIFTNFILNSMLHAFDETDKGSIRIDVAIINEDLVVKYSDTGKGIPAKNLPKIFDPFFTTNMQHGTGLGMNITYNLVTQKLKGEISLESEVNKGVLFTIVIPLSQIQ